MARRFRPALAALLVLMHARLGMFGAGTARAQDYPSRPIFFVVGPGPDALARLFGQKLTAAWGQQVLIDIAADRPAASWRRATSRKAAPDGHTLLLTTGAYTVMQALRPDLPVNLLRDFEPVAPIGSLSFLLLAKNALPVKSLDDLIKLARAKPGQINCASSGVGTTSHLGCEMLKKFANIDIVHVPYKGAGPALTDLIGGYVDIFFSVPTAAPQVKAGDVRALAVTGAKRLAAFPEVPTVAEGGLPDLDVRLVERRACPGGDAEADHRQAQRRDRQGTQSAGHPAAHDRLRLYAGRRHAGGVRRLRQARSRRMDQGREGDRREGGMMIAIALRSAAHSRATRGHRLGFARVRTDRRLRSAARSDRARALFRRGSGLGPAQASLSLDRHHRRHDLRVVAGRRPEGADSSLEPRQRHDLRSRGPAGRRRLVAAHDLAHRARRLARHHRVPLPGQEVQQPERHRRALGRHACTGPIPPAAW